MNLIGWLKKKTSQKLKETRQFKMKAKNMLKELRATSFSFQGNGPRKTECQDSFTIIDTQKPNFYLMGVFDGHGNSGKEASIAASENFYKYFDKNYEHFQKLNNKEEIELFLKKSFQFVERKMKKSGIDYNYSGSCALVIIIYNSTISIANLGDSRAVLCRQEKDTLAIEISIDHKPTRKIEKQRILENGGKIEKLNYNGQCIGPYRVWANEEGPGYAITRSLGDFKAKKIGYISEPEIDHLSLKSQDRFIVLASDGIWDVMSSAEVIGFILQNKECWGYENQIAEKLAKEARQRWEENNTQNTFNNRISDFPSAKYGIDDITVIICFLYFEDKKVTKKIDLYMKLLNHVLKSPNDKLKYKPIELINGLKIMLIQDKDTQKCSAVMNVSRGVFSDPEEMAGIAHFLEHMLFMGSKKYPDPSYYRDQVSKFSGSCNAYTDLMNTVYYYQSNKEGFMQCLDIFGQFFIEPLLDKKYVMKELKAVNSEFEKNFKNDFWRSFNLRRRLAQENSLLRKFSTGNMDTLNKENVLDVLRKFYDENYSANLMNLVIYQEKDMEEIEKDVIEIFNKIPNKNIQDYQFDASQFPYQKDQLCKQVNYQSFSENHQVEFFFFFESQQKHYMNDPVSLLSSLIGHESKGSVAYLLKERDLIFDLTTSPYSQGDYFGFLMIRIQLTKKGYENFDEVHRALATYIQMLKKEGVPEWFFQEQKQTRKNKFEFIQQSSSLSVALNIACKMDTYPIELVSKVPYLMENYDTELINKYINLLTAKNLLVMMSHNSFENLPLKEKYYQTPYEVKDFNQNVINIWNGSAEQKDTELLHLPAKNTFIPENFQIENLKGSEFPLYIQKEDNENFGEVFYKFDDKFKSSKIDMRYKLFTSVDGVGVDPSVYIKMSLWSNILQNYLMDFSYLANEAGITTDIAYTHEGVYIRIYGFSDKLDVYCKELANKILEFSLNKSEDFLRKEFESNKQKKLLQYKKLLLQYPFRLQLQERDILMRENQFDYQTLTWACQKINFEQFQQFFAKFLNSFYYRSYLTGNLSEQKALEINENFINTLKQIGQQRAGEFQTLPFNRILKKRCIQLEEKVTNILTRYLEKDEEQNDCVLVNYQCSTQDIKNREYMILLENYLDPKAFHHLRTELQLGYVVFVRNQKFSNVCNLQFMIQSSDFLGVECVGQIYKFVNEMKNQLLNITEKELDELKQNYVKSLEQKFNNISEESSFYWNKIKLGNYEFNAIKNSQEAAQKITLNEFRQFINDLLYEKKRVLEYYLLSKKNQEKNKEGLKLRELYSTNELVKFDDFQTLKNSLNLYKDQNNQIKYHKKQIIQYQSLYTQFIMQNSDDIFDQIFMLFEDHEKIEENFDFQIEKTEALKNNHAFKKLYSENLQRALDTFRYLLENQEISQRGLILSQYIISQIGNHYPAWFYRKQYFQNEKDIQSIKKDIVMTKKFIQNSPKGFQSWDYLEYCYELIEQQFQYEQTKQFLQSILEIDNRNYHCWQFRIWMTQKFNLFDKEKQFIDKEIENDVTNNSYWNYMYFINSNLKNQKDKQPTIDRAIQLLELNYENESAWNYLNALYEQENQIETLIEYCQQILKKYPSNRFCIATLVFKLMQKNKQDYKEQIKNHLQKLKKIDNLRKGYWNWIEQKLEN